MVIPLHDRNPVRRTTYVTYGLIAVNVVVFLASPESGVSPFFGSGSGRSCAETLYYFHFSAVPRELLSGHPLPFRPAAGCPPVTPGKIPFLSVLTAMFVHANWFHLLGNMLFLYVFGNNVEDRMGRVRYLVFYLVSGYVATYGYALSAAGSTSEVLGASGAIAGVLGAYLYLFPRAKVIGLVPFLFYIPLRLPAWLVLGFWFVLQWVAFQGQGTGEVAYAAHVVGFACGFAYAWLRYRHAQPHASAPPPAPGGPWSSQLRALPWSEQWTAARPGAGRAEDGDGGEGGWGPDGEGPGGDVPEEGAPGRVVPEMAGPEVPGLDNPAAAGRATRDGASGAGAGADADAGAGARAGSAAGSVSAEVPPPSTAPARPGGLSPTPIVKPTPGQMRVGGGRPVDNFPSDPAVPTFGRSTTGSPHAPDPDHPGSGGPRHDGIARGDGGTAGHAPGFPDDPPPTPPVAAPRG